MSRLTRSAKPATTNSGCSHWQTIETISAANAHKPRSGLVGRVGSNPRPADYENHASVRQGVCLRRRPCGRVSTPFACALRRILIGTLIRSLRSRQSISGDSRSSGAGARAWPSSARAADPGGLARSPMTSCEPFKPELTSRPYRLRRTSHTKFLTVPLIRNPARYP